MDLYLSKKAYGVVDEIKETKGESRESAHNKLLMATKELIKELGDGVEFHLSLNPPEYAEETAGSLTIDYKKMPAIETKKELKQIATSTEDAKIVAGESTEEKLEEKKE